MNRECQLHLRSLILFYSWTVAVHFCLIACWVHGQGAHVYGCIHIKFSLEHFIYFFFGTCSFLLWNTLFFIFFWRNKKLLKWITISELSKFYNYGVHKNLIVRLSWNWYWIYLLVFYLGHKNWVLYIAWSPDGKHLASGSKSGELLTWDPQTGKQSGKPLMVKSMEQPFYISIYRAASLIRTLFLVL